MKLRLAGLLLTGALCALAQNGRITASQQVARFKTTLGDIDVALLRAQAPNTVDNFLNYVNKGAYDGTFFHRTVREFIIQAGGYKFVNGKVTDIPADAPVANEFNIANNRGTLAMAKLDGDPHSGSNQWFFNLKDNRANLDRQNGGFTVFGRVLTPASLAVMDALGDVPTIDADGGLFTNLPVRNYTSGATVTDDNLIKVLSIKLVPGIVNASTPADFGGVAVAAPGSLLEITGVGVAGSERSWKRKDFEGTEEQPDLKKAPTSLDDVSVTIGEKPAYVKSVSPSKIVVQVAEDTPLGKVPVVVTWNGESSPAVNITIQETAGGILAPASWLIEERQFAQAVHADGSAVARGVEDVADAPAQPGEKITLLGVGFGPVSEPVAVAGRIVDQENTLQNPLEILIDGRTAEVTRAGLARGTVGIYRIEVIVPANTSSGDVEMEIRQNGEMIPQGILFLPVGNL